MYFMHDVTLQSKQGMKTEQLTLQTEACSLARGNTTGIMHAAKG